MKKKKLTGLVLAMAAVLTLTACGGSPEAKSKATYDIAEGAYEEDYYAAEEEFLPEEYAAETMAAMENGIGSTGEKQVPEADSARKLIRYITLDLQTEDFDTLKQTVLDRITEVGGYIEESTIYGDDMHSAGCRSAYIVARIPSDRLDEFVEAASGAGYLTRKDERTEDVTLQYTDVESHITALETEESRILELLEKAETVEELMQIEQRLSDIRYELEYYESSRRTYDNLVDYSTVTLNLDEVARIVEEPEDTLLDRMGSGLKETFHGLAVGSGNLLVAFVAALPILVLLAAFGFALFLIVRRVAYGPKAERMARKQAKAEAKKAAQAYAAANAQGANAAPAGMDPHCPPMGKGNPSGPTEKK